MSDDWIMVRLPRSLHKQLRDLGERLDLARSKGHPCLQALDPPLAVHTLIERLLAHYERHATRRSTSARRKQVRARAELYFHKGGHGHG